MAISGPALGITGAGIIVLISGIKGYSITQVIQDIVIGQDPRTALANQFSASSASTSPASGGSGTPATPGNTGMASVATGSEGSFISAFLGNLGAPSTPANLSSVQGWIAHEKPAGNPLQWNNPLNIGTPGSDSAGRIGTYSVGPGIAEYDNPTDGARADADFILNNGYTVILSLLRAGKGLKTGAESELLAWSGGAYSSV